MNLPRLLDGRQRFLPPTQVSETGGQVGERVRQSGSEGIGPRGGKLAANLHRLLDGC
jgi:hypothetical protein